MGSSGSPAEGDDAGDTTDLDEEYRNAQVRTYRTQANQHMERAKRLVGHLPSMSEMEARSSLDCAARAFWWADEGELEETQHDLLHRYGRWTRKAFGCPIPFENGEYRQRCPVDIAHNRVGQSIGALSIQRCSICAEDLSECPHLKDRSYWVRGGPWDQGACRICHQQDCRHLPDHLYRARVIALVEIVEIREISYVRRPGNPEARLTDVPFASIAALRERLGPTFTPGTPLSCDQCLTACTGFTEFMPDDAASDS